MSALVLKKKKKKTTTTTTTTEIWTCRCSFPRNVYFTVFILFIRLHRSKNKTFRRIKSFREGLGSSSPEH